MDWKSIAVYLIIFWIGLFIGALGKETVKWVVKMIGAYIKQCLIKRGIITGDFDVIFGKFRPSTKQSDDSDWSIKIQHPHKKIEKCNVVFAKKKVLWDNKEPYRFIIAWGGANIPIPKKDFIENTRVELWDGKKILLNKKFEDLPLLDK